MATMSNEQIRTIAEAIHNRAALDYVNGKVTLATLKPKKLMTQKLKKKLDKAKWMVEDAKNYFLNKNGMFELWGGHEANGPKIIRRLDQIAKARIRKIKSQKKEAAAV